VSDYQLFKGMSASKPTYICKNKLVTHRNVYSTLKRTFFRRYAYPTLSNLFRTSNNYVPGKGLILASPNLI